MFFLPAPGLLVVLLGLAILGTEFIWARNLLQRVKDRIRKKSDNQQKPKS